VDLGRVDLRRRSVIDPLAVRAQFPALEAPGVVYLDSASTTQVPRRVIEALTRHLAEATANPGRGGYPWSTRAARLVEDVRARVAGFIGADAEEIVFTAGATAGLNAVASAWAEANLHDGDEVLYSPADHASLVLPWIGLRDNLAARGVRIRLVPYRTTATGEADTEDIAGKLTQRTRLILVSHVHGVFGARTTLRELRGRVPEATRLLFDCSQSVGHIPIEVHELRADFVTFSAHKMFGLPGTGVLYCRRTTHAELAPFMPGGGVGLRVDENPATGEPTLRVDSIPGALEGGTLNTPGIIALGEAIAFVEDLGPDLIAEHSRAITLHLVDGLQRLRRIELLPGVAYAGCGVGYGIASFVVRGECADDIGFALSSMGFYVRTGRHCLTGDRFPDSVRVSAHVYTTHEDVDRFLEALAHVTEGGA